MCSCKRVGSGYVQGGALDAWPAVLLAGGRQQLHPQHGRALQAAEAAGGGAHLQPDPDPLAGRAHPHTALYGRGQHAARRLPRALGLPRRL